MNSAKTTALGLVALAVAALAGYGGGGSGVMMSQAPADSAGYTSYLNGDAVGTTTPATSAAVLVSAKVMSIGRHSEASGVAGVFSFNSDARLANHLRVQSQPLDLAAVRAMVQSDLGECGSQFSADRLLIGAFHDREYSPTTRNHATLPGGDGVTVLGDATLRIRRLAVYSMATLAGSLAMAPR